MDLPLGTELYSHTQIPMPAMPQASDYMKVDTCQLHCGPRLQRPNSGVEPPLHDPATATASLVPPAAVYMCKSPVV